MYEKSEEFLPFIFDPIIYTNLQPRTSDLEPRTSNLELRTSSLEPRTSSLEPQTSDVEPFNILTPLNFERTSCFDISAHESGMVQPQ